MDNKKVSRLKLDKLKLQWDIRKIAAGVLKGDEAIGDILAAQDDVEILRYLTDKGFDFLPSETETKTVNLPDNLQDIIHDALTSEKIEYDGFGNARTWSQKEIIKEQMDKLEELGRKLLEEEKYEAMQEAREIYEKLKIEYNRL